MDIQKVFTQDRKMIERALRAYLPRRGACNEKLRLAIEHAVMAGGKRIRPILLIEAARAVGGSRAQALPAACAIEFIHSYSLAHDDLPCMDDDAMRRGQPTVHKKFGQATALLAGDALLTLAFETLARGNGGRSETVVQRQLEASRLIAAAAGSAGMVGGQQEDLAGRRGGLSLQRQRDINEKKTGALIAVAARVGALIGGGAPGQIKALERYGRALGLLFQIVDDILDNEGYAKVMGAARAKIEARRVVQIAKKSLKSIGIRAENLVQIADFVYCRDH